MFKSDELIFHGVIKPGETGVFLGNHLNRTNINKNITNKQHKKFRDVRTENDIMYALKYIRMLIQRTLNTRIQCIHDNY